MSGLAQGGAVFAFLISDTGSMFAFNTATSVYGSPDVSPDTVNGQSMLPLAGAVAIGFGAISDTTACVPGSSALFSNTSFHSNIASLGGAIALCGEYNSVQGFQLSIQNNSAVIGGAIAVLNNAQVILMGGTLLQNSALFGGAVAVADASHFALMGSVVATNNTAQYQGGLVYVSVTHGLVYFDPASVVTENWYDALCSGLYL